MRNKKLINLNRIVEQADASLNNSRNLRRHSNEDKPRQIFIDKFVDNSIGHRFQPKKILPTQLDSGQRKTRFKSIRIHTQKFNSLQKQKQSIIQRSRTIPIKQEEKDIKYPFLTIFEKQEVIRYEVYFIGRRRINAIKDFTNSNCEAKVLIGDSIAYRYEIIAALGQGSFGQVFRSFDHKRKQFVALKVIRNQPKFNKQAKVEIKILQNVMIYDPKFKSNIVQLKHAFFFRGHACLVFELLHINLYELSKQLKFNGLSMDMIRRISIQILQGLLFLKRQNIIHCDLKPQNILLKQQNKSGIKIIDLGSGCFENQQIYTYIQSRFYRAPEIILGMAYTSAIDIWSTGCILCQLFLGFPIFPGENQHQQILMFIQMLGVPPQSLIQRGSRSSKFFEGNLPRIKPNSKGKIRRPGAKSIQSLLCECEDSEFISFIKKFFIWQPDERIIPEEALVDQWILKGLPTEIKKQHIATVGKDYF